MTLGEVRRDALRLMFAGYEDILEEMTFSELYQNERYQPYVMGIDMGVNRAYSYLLSQQLVPLSRLHLEPTGDGYTVDLKTLDPYIGKVFGVEDQHGSAVVYWMEGTTIVVPFSYTGQTLTVRYTPKWVRVDNTTSDDYLLPLDDEVAALIPYWIKSELYEEENYAAARNARAYFEEGVARLKQSQGEGMAFVVKYGI